MSVKNVLFDNRIQIDGAVWHTNYLFFTYIQGNKAWSDLTGHETF
jgi:hypothetical protein